MTTILDIVDTAVKIGLGASIAGLTSYFLSDRSHKNELEKSAIEDKKNLVKELTIKLENVEACVNEAALHFHSGDVIKAKTALLPATSDAYSVRAISNLVGNKEMVHAMNGITDIVENIYFELNSAQPCQGALDNLDRKLTKVKLAVYPHIRNTYLESNA
ncbi:hypothetical protein [Bacterioplanoides sp. SCSIO 12839]|uniref:hypothetical protein n=1 Tax=Bacterioplanoides sp. SCSIO 12839 TaxID=2829569 RepID=UPI002101FB2E|nr:hypothetical protein [Bacterioplanoides sp. SCSIO 12839]UTW48864.1 hypothetical protein KFF03_02850 [Bacterioplanoides sp. SCSIO 12839]